MKYKNIESGVIYEPKKPEVEKMYQSDPKFIEVTAEKQVDPEEAALRAKAKELGISNYHNMKIEKLLIKIAEVESSGNE